MLIKNKETIDFFSDERLLNKKIRNDMHNKIAWRSLYEGSLPSVSIRFSKSLSKNYLNASKYIPNHSILVH